MPRFDHHVHTSRHSPDSCIDPEELVERTREAGLDGVVITDHDFQWPEEELEELRAMAPDLVILSGVEVSAREGHFLVYGLPDHDYAPPGIRLVDLLEVVRLERAAIVAAHPFRWGQDFRGLVEEHGPAFDALELVSNNVTAETRRLAQELLADYPMAATGSSDGHEPAIVGCYFTEFLRPVRTMADFVAGLHSRSVRPGHNACGAPLASGPVGCDPIPVGMPRR